MSEFQPGAEGRAAKYRKRPVVIEAVQYRPDLTPCNCAEVAEFAGFDPPSCAEMGDGHDDARWLISTLEGDMSISPGDWVIRGVAGELYPCKPDIFEQTYEEVES